MLSDTVSVMTKAGQSFDRCLAILGWTGPGPLFYAGWWRGYKEGEGKEKFRISGLRSQQLIGYKRGSTSN